jgi:hypothetical protein
MKKKTSPKTGFSFVHIKPGFLSKHLVFWHNLLLLWVLVDLPVGVYDNHMVVYTTHPIISSKVIKHIDNTPSIDFELVGSPVSKTSPKTNK